MEQVKKVNAEVVEIKKSQESKALVSFGNSEVVEFIKRDGVRKINTIPVGVELEVTFTSSELAVGKYPYKEQGMTKERETIAAKAIVKYNAEASHLICGVEFPLAMSKNALIGLGNYLNANDKATNLEGRTFRVINRNKQTYIWTEVMTEEKTNEGTEQQI